MISQESLQFTKIELLQSLIIIISSHLLVEVVGSRKFFNESWLVSTGGHLLGNVIHGLITRNLNKYFNLSEPFKSTVSDIIKVLTILITKNLFEMYFNNEAQGIFEIDKTKNWLLSTMLMTVGFMIYNLFIKKHMPKFLTDRPALIKTTKVAIATIFTDFLPDQDIEPSTLAIIGGRLIGVMSYHTLLPEGAISAD